jgi:glycosyltransferase involved in cell wall biosynthesis
MRVSVIIPVYNAAAYVEHAVQSALDQPETGEVILVEDASADDSLAVCQRLEQKHSQVRLVRHRGGQNRGAGASRNAGIHHSRFELIAFLDADDYYLAERFSFPIRMLEQNSSADGIYEASQDFYDTEEILQRHEKAGTRKVRLNTLRSPVPPEDLFRRMHLESIGHFWICSMTLRARVFERVGMFDESLPVAQDKVLIRKMAALCNLYAGRLDQPVVMRRVHHRNRVTGVRRSTKEWIRVRRQDWETMRAWGESRLNPNQKQILLTHFMASLNHGIRLHHPLAHFIPWQWLSIWTLISLGRDYPDLRRQRYYWRQFLRTCLLAVYPPHLIRGLWLSLRRSIARRVVAFPRSTAKA